MVRARVFGAQLLLVATAGAVLFSCDRNGDDAGSRRVDVLVAAIRDVVGDQSDVNAGEALPVVFVVKVGEQGVAATVQADVAAELHDEVDVRFADERDEAIETEAVGQPVHDSGVLLVVGDIPEEGSTIDVPIEIYRSEDEASSIVFTLVGGASSWAVTATSQVTLAGA
jgi:hypothetical protein